LSLLLQSVDLNTTTASSTTTNITTNNTNNAQIATTRYHLSAAKSWYAVDISGDLPATRAAMEPFVARCAARWDQWEGFMNDMPSEQGLR
jgi:hypothetical protein